MTGFSLQGKRGLITGIANEHSIAYGCAKAMQAAGAELAVTYLNDKAHPHVEPLATELDASLFLPLDLRKEGELESTFNTIRDQWGELDFLLHAVAFAKGEDLNGRVTDCSQDGFALAMDISCHSFIRMAKLAEPLMKHGGSLMTLTYHGSERVIPGYGIMGPVKAALESATRYMATELGPQRIRVNAISAGLLPTRAASGIAAFDTMYERAKHEAPLPAETLTIDDVGNMAAFLASDAAKAITGAIHYVDAGYHITD